MLRNSYTKDYVKFVIDNFNPLETQLINLEVDEKISRKTFFGESTILYCKFLFDILLQTITSDS